MKKLFRFFSDVAWRLGLERLSLRFLLASLDGSTNVESNTITLSNVPNEHVCGAIKPIVVFEDVVLIRDLGFTSSGVKVPLSMMDVN